MAGGGHLHDFVIKVTWIWADIPQSKYLPISFYGIDKI